MAFLSLGCNSLPAPGHKVTAIPSPTITPGAQKREGLVAEAKKTMIHSKKGQPWLLQALKSRYLDGQQQAQLEGVDWTLSDREGKKLIRIQAPKAVFKIDSEMLEFVGGVEARRYDTRDLLKAKKMNWSSKTGVLTGSQGVSWDRGQTHVEGDTLTTTDKLERILLNGNVRVTVVLEGDPFDSGG